MSALGVSPRFSAGAGLAFSPARADNRGVMASLDRLLRKLGLRHQSDDEPAKNKDEEVSPPVTSDSGAGLRHGQIPPGYVPPADEGRPPH
jgi:hypothetical protein